VQGRTSTFGFVVGAVASALALAAIGTAANHSDTPDRLGAKHARTDVSATQSPLAFEPNAGRTDRRVRYLAQGPGYSVFLTAEGSTLALAHGDVLRTTLDGAASGPPTAERRLQGVVNDYRDGRSIVGLHTFGRVRYPGVYPGIDVVYHGHQGSLEYDFELAAGADPRRIGLRLSGQRQLAIDRNGDLLVRGTHGSLRQHRPFAFQRIGSRRVAVAARYVVTGGRVAFRLGDYDRTRELVIDPVLSYSTYLGGSGADHPEGVAIGPNKSVFVAGYTKSNDFPAATARDGARTDEDAFVTAHDSTGTRAWTTYLGGTGNDRAHDLAVDGAGRVYVVGETTSTGIEMTTSNLPALDTCADATVDGLLARLSANGQQTYLTCFGGNGADVANGVAVRDQSSGAAAYVTGSTASTDFTAPSGSKAPFQASSAGGLDAFLAQISFGDDTCLAGAGPCATLPYRTYLGGTGDDTARGVALYSTLGAYVTGGTGSTDFPVTVGFDASGSLYFDAFVAKFDTSASNPGTNRIYSRYFGGTNGSTSARAIAANANGDAFIAGESAASDLPFPWTGTEKSTGVDGFVGEVGSTGTACCSAYLGGAGTDRFYDLALQDNGAALVIGETNSALSPQNGIPNQSCSAGNNRVLVGKFHAGANPKWIYTSCVGGNMPPLIGERRMSIAAATAGSDGGAWITGETVGFPVVGAPQPNYGGGTTDGFLAQIVQRAPDITDGPSGIIATKAAQFTFTTPEADMGFECSTPDVDRRLNAGSRSASSCDLSGSTATYSNLAEGDHRFEVATVDDVNAKSAPAARTFTVDTLPPAAFDLIAPAEGEATGTTPSFSWSRPSDGTDVTYQLLVDGNKLQDVPASACDATTCSVQAATAIPTGDRNWKVVAVDAVGHTTGSATTRGFKVVLPPVARLVVSPNPALVGNSVTFDGSGSADATHTITKYEWDLDGDGTFERETGATATTTNSYASAGTLNVGLRVTDNAGSTNSTTAELKISAAGGGSGTVGVSINKGAQYTNKPSVTLLIAAPAGTTSLLLANDGGFAGALPAPLAKEVAWKLDSSGPERLPKTVYVRFLTGPFASPNYTDDIILDERPPVVDSASVVGPPAAAIATAAKTKTYKVKVKARDTNSGVGFVQITTNKKKPGKLIPYKKTVKAKSTKRPKFLRARDRAGNFSKWRKLR
jgi:hypothetical protein